MQGKPYVTSTDTGTFKAPSKLEQLAIDGQLNEDMIVPPSLNAFDFLDEQPSHLARGASKTSAILSKVPSQKQKNSGFIPQLKPAISDWFNGSGAQKGPQNMRDMRFGSILQPNNVFTGQKGSIMDFGKFDDLDNVDSGLPDTDFQLSKLRSFSKKESHMKQPNLGNSPSIVPPVKDDAGFKSLFSMNPPGISKNSSFKPYSKPQPQSSTEQLEANPMSNKYSLKAHIEQQNGFPETKNLN